MGHLEAPRPDASARRALGEFAFYALFLAHSRARQPIVSCDEAVFHVMQHLAEMQEVRMSVPVLVRLYHIPVS